MKKEVDFNIFKAQILEEIKADKPLFGKDGALAPMIENIAWAHPQHLMQDPAWKRCSPMFAE